MIQRITFLTAVLGLTMSFGVHDSMATSCYWSDLDATTRQISYSNPGSWTAAASIDAAINAAGGLGTRNTFQFLDTFAAVSINETIKLYDGVIYKGVDAGTRLTWMAGTDAFGNNNNVSSSVTVQHLKISTSGAGRGFYWTASVNNRTNTVTMRYCILTSETNGIHLTNENVANTGISVTADVQNSRIAVTEDTATAIYLKARNSTMGTYGIATARVTGSRLESAGSGIRIEGTSSSTFGKGRAFITSSEIVCTDPNPDSTDSGIGFTASASQEFLYVAGTRISGFNAGIAGDWPFGFPDNDTIKEKTHLINNTIVSNTIGWRMGQSAPSGGWEIRPVMVNNIFAGNSTGVVLTGSASCQINAYGVSNAFFANGAISSLSAGTSLNDSNRLTLAYSLQDAFVAPSGGDYHLKSSARDLLKIGARKTNAAAFPGYTIVYVDANDNGDYTSGQDYIVSLGGYGGDTTGHLLLLTDAVGRPRILGNAIDLGAYARGSGTVLTIR